MYLGCLLGFIYRHSFEIVDQYPEVNLAKLVGLKLLCFIIMMLPGLVLLVIFMIFTDINAIVSMFFGMGLPIFYVVFMLFGGYMQRFTRKHWGI